MASPNGSTWLRRGTRWLLVAFVLPLLLPAGIAPVAAAGRNGLVDHAVAGATNPAPPALPRADAFEVVCTPDTFQPDVWTVIECTTVITNSTQDVAPGGYLGVVTVSGPIPDYFWISNVRDGEYVPVGTGDLNFKGDSLQPGQSSESHLIGLLRMSEGAWRGEDTLFSGDRQVATASVQLVAANGAEAPLADLTVTKELVETVTATPTSLLPDGRDARAPTPTCPPPSWEDTPTPIPPGYVEPTPTPAPWESQRPSTDLGPNSGWSPLSPEEFELERERSELARRYYEKKLAGEPLGCLADDMKAWAKKVGDPDAYGDISRDSLPGPDATRSGRASSAQKVVYETKITNQGSATITDLTITDRIEDVDLLEAEPAAAGRNDAVHLATWDLASFGRDSLAPGESLVLRTTYGPGDSGCSTTISGGVVEADVGGTVERYGTRPEEEVLLGDCDYSNNGDSDYYASSISPLTGREIPMAFGRGGEGPSNSTFDVLWAATCLAAGGTTLVGLATVARRRIRR